MENPTSNGSKSAGRQGGRSEGTRSAAQQREAEGNGGRQEQQQQGRQPGQSGGGSAAMQRGGGPQDRQMAGRSRGGELGLARRPSHPLAMMMQLSQEMDRLMDAFFNRGWIGPAEGSMGSMGSMGMNALWSPQVDVHQRGDSLVVRADLPGIRREDVQIELNEDGLTIFGERREEHQEGGEEQGYRHVERSYGSFFRTIPLPEGAQPDACKASMKDGVLEVVIPLEQQQNRRRRIQIES